MGKRKEPGDGRDGQAPLVLIAEDDDGMRELLVSILADAGWATDGVRDGGEALEALEKREPTVVLTDLKMPGVDGMELLRRVKRSYPELPVVVLTAHGSVPGAVEAMKLGAFDFLSKPLPSPQHLRDVMERAARSGGGAPVSKEEGPVGRDPSFLRVLELARAVAARDTTVLIAGESGTGKEVIARFIHRQSDRRERPFVAVNCAAIPENLLESELFGHERGAFTGAAATRRGILEQAHTGSLLLDEVSELSPALQAKFLRVLEERKVVRVGGSREIEVDVRLLAATNRDLEREVEEGRFRKDLFFRLNVFPIEVPPLRDRPRDIVPLANYFLSILGSGTSRPSPFLTPEGEAALEAHDWPGNVRELQNVLERAVILAGSGAIAPADLGFGPADERSFSREKGEPAEGLTLKELERRAIADALAAVGGHRRKAAKRLGIALRTLQYKIKEYGL